MTASQHAEEAERLLARAKAFNPKNGEARAEAKLLTAQAQAHATLAAALWGGRK